MTKNKNKNKNKLNEQEEDLPILFTNPDDHKNIAAQILGVGCERFSDVIIDINNNEFYYSEYGVELRFKLIDEKWQITNTSRTRRQCVQAAYWLIDKLARESKLFYSPGREGIKR